MLRIWSISAAFSSDFNQLICTKLLPGRNQVILGALGVYFGKHLNGWAQLIDILQRLNCYDGVGTAEDSRA